MKKASFAKLITANFKTVSRTEEVQCGIVMFKEKHESGIRNSELTVEGYFTRKGIKVSSKGDIDALSSRGFGTRDNGNLILTFYEALYLIDKGTLLVRSKSKKEIGFRDILSQFETSSENAWSQYLTYRDLRSRGYVVREGFGTGIAFRVYERGEYSKDSAKYLVLSVQEGKPISVKDLTNALTQSLSLKKELVLAVMNRRGETVYYSVSQLNLK